MHLRRRASTVPSASSKKRQYEELVNRCRNPFCGAVLENKQQQHCETNRFCQLHRGIMLHCAWPHAPEYFGGGDVMMAPPSAKTDSTVGTSTTESVAETGTSTTSITSARAWGTSDDKVQVEKRPRSANPSAVEVSTSSKKAKVATGNDNPTTTTSQQAKPTAIDPIALGVGSRGGGGGRYVQSGIRAHASGAYGGMESAAIVRPPSFSRFPTTIPTTPTTTAAIASTAIRTGASAASVTGSYPPSRSPSPLVPPLPATRQVTPPPAHSRTFIPNNSIAAATTSSNRDPRVRMAPTASGARDDVATASSGSRRISAADYHSNRRRDGTSDASSTVIDLSTSMETLLTAPTPAARNGSHRHERQPARDPGAAYFAPSIKSDVHDPQGKMYERPNDDWAAYRAKGGDPHTDNHRTHGVRYSSGPSHTSEWNSRPPSGERSHGSRSSSSSHSNRHGRHSNTVSVSRAERLFATLLCPQFSYCDRFVKLILTRMASFLPGALSAVRNKTTKPRKLQFYLGYARRVEEYCGALVKIAVEGGVARVVVAGREWLAVKGSSTMDMYHQLLEKLLSQSEAWRDLIVEHKSLLSDEERRFGRHVNVGKTFWTLWSTMKLRQAKSASALNFQSSFTAGDRHFHWSFVVSNVEIGSGSAIQKLDAFKSAAATAFDFISDLMILPDRDKFDVARIDGQKSSSASSAAGNSPRRRGSSSPFASSARTFSVPAPHLASVAASLQSTATVPASERILDDPTSTTASDTQRQRSDSWNDLNALDSTFSPVQRSEQSETDDDDRMSISDNDDVTAEKASTASAISSATTSAVGSNVAPADPSPVLAPMPAAPCRFCIDMQAHKTGAKCFRGVVTDRA